MDLQTLMVPAAEAVAEIMRGAGGDRLGGPTPCEEFDVRALINHMILWNGRGETAAHKLPPEGPGEDHDFTAEPGWAEPFALQARKTAEAWTDPAAWEGKTSMTGGNDGMPAPFIGGIIFVECILHGWDLAVATGQRPRFGDELVEAAFEQVMSMAEMSRQYKVFGPEVPVQESAPLLDRTLGMAGRDPDWTP